jgi:hypothetical protein
VTGLWNPLSFDTLWTTSAALAHRNGACIVGAIAQFRAIGAENETLEGVDFGGQRRRRLCLAGRVAGGG